MNNKTALKEELKKILQSQLNSKIELLQNLITSAKESRDGETKSSMGDKYETARSMAQIEIQKNEIQLNKLLKQADELAKIDTSKMHQIVVFGSLVQTNRGFYFISIGIGKVTVSNNNFYAISMASPIGQLLQNKGEGETFTFHGAEFKIESII